MGSTRVNKRRVWWLALVLYAASFAGLAVSILLRNSDELWLVWLIYASTGALLIAVLVTLFGISLIGDG